MIQTQKVHENKNDNVLQGGSVLEMSSCLHNIYLSDLAMSRPSPPRQQEDHKKHLSSLWRSALRRITHGRTRERVVEPRGQSPGRVGMASWDSAVAKELNIEC